MKFLTLIVFMILLTSGTNAEVFRVRCDFKEIHHVTTTRQEGFTEVEIVFLEEDPDYFSLQETRPQQFIIEGEFLESELELNLVMIRRGWYPKCGLDISHL